MRFSVILATLATGACVMALPRQANEKPSDESFELRIFSMNSTEVLARGHTPITVGPGSDLTICQPKKRYDWICEGEWGQINPTCGFTDWCNTYLYPHKSESICIEDGDLFWNVECCIEALKRSCGNKLPKQIWVDPPKSS